MALQQGAFKHQSAFATAPFKYEDTHYYFLIGGYGCGKSFSGVLFILALVARYNGQKCSIGIGGASQTLLRLTLLKDLFQKLQEAGIPYQHNSQAHTVTIGTLDFIYISMSDPELIYAYNFCIFIGDELDELPQEKALAAFTAIQERTRMICPDGREAFSVFMTTAQGLKGTYRIIENLKKTKDRHMVIRGKTKNNTTLSKNYVARLYALYTEIEARAYLEGEFVNLRTGRMYPDYDEKVNMVDPTYVPGTATVYVGQDINSGFSKACVIYQEGDILHVVKSYSFDSVGVAPRTLREMFPTQRIVWLPDASSKEIMAGYTDEVRENNIELVQRGINPSVTDRILVINKLFRLRKLFIWSNVEELPVALKTRQFNDDGKPSKGKGPLAPDHICDALEYAVWHVFVVKKQWDDLKELLHIKKSN